MHVLISYDISDNRTRGRFHKFLKEFGLNTQKSVFECDLDEQGVVRVMAEAHASLDKATDSLRLYRICSRCQRNVVVSGQGLMVVQLDFMIV
jgi:CRISPR-associated protein Cas2